jgi:hypothetical protein
LNTFTNPIAHLLILFIDHKKNPALMAGSSYVNL